MTTPYYPTVGKETLAGALQYISDYWPKIIQEPEKPRGRRKDPSLDPPVTLLRLNYPYLVPRHEDERNIFRDMFYWDSYFMSLGVVNTEYESVIVGMAENMADLVLQLGYIPNATGTGLQSRSQPPFFTQQIWLAYEVKLRRDGARKARTFLRRMMMWAKKEHEWCWLGTAYKRQRLVYRGLSRYYDTNESHFHAGCESGWDHSTRCDGLWKDHLPVDLNSILYVREKDFARAAKLLGNKEEEKKWEERATTRAETMQRLMWDEAQGFFFDYNFVEEQRNLRHPSLAGFYTLWSGIATSQEADRMVAEWLTKFLKPGGLVTTFERDKECQWARPNGWAPLQWIVAAGLDNYGKEQEAQGIRAAWCNNCLAVFEKEGEFWEKYNVEDIGAPPEGSLYGHLNGFGWSNAVFVDFARRLGLT